MSSEAKLVLRDETVLGKLVTKEAREVVGVFTWVGHLINNDMYT